MHWTINLISKENDIDVDISGIPADSFEAARDFALNCMSNPKIWLAIEPEE